MSSTSSKTSGSPPAEPSERPRQLPRTDLPETIAVGRILRPHGLRGEVAVEVLTDSPRRLAPGSSLLLVREGEPPVPMRVAARRGAAPAAATGKGKALAADSRPSRPRRSFQLLRLAGVEDRAAAEALRGAWLEIERSRVPAAPPGTYYHYELVGCRCVAAGEVLGEVVEVVEDGGGVLLVVSDGRREVPVPFVARFLRAVDVERATIELELPPGLVEACASRS
jgi:16S rRNA processing protein RimM